ncbi:MAG: tRNA-specific 2-thiouridylase [Candidatus Saccharibacteria bacterium]|nr:tRNA-specific 2-thiouridylase [Candidatus Saccharibacteria bacterium]
MAKVWVGMSGGVDSSVAAALLVEQRHDVTGVYMKNWAEDLPGMHCPWADDVADAKRVAVGLGIDFQVVDFQAEYKQHVVEYMVREYQAGRTPNPDVMCNQEMKFGVFWRAAMEAGVDVVATGHYARVEHFDHTASPVTRSAPRDIFLAEKSSRGAAPPRATRSAATASCEVSGGPEKNLGNFMRDPDCFSDSSEQASAQLLRARDANKDQTYFLYRVSGEALGRTLFPLGDYTKDEVRRMAKDRGLWTADKKESMGICFVGQVGIREFLSEYVETTPGDIIDRQTSQVVGQHDGAIFYTIGQRHGLNVGGGLPYYVVGKDMVKNEVYVSRSLDDERLWRTDIALVDEHWINQPPGDGAQIRVRLRHRGALIDAIYSAGTLQLASPERAVAPGQSAVVYDGEVCLGGGIVTG